MFYVSRNLATFHNLPANSANLDNDISQNFCSASRISKELWLRGQGTTGGLPHHFPKVQPEVALDK